MQRFQRLTTIVARKLILPFAQDDINPCCPSLTHRSAPAFSRSLADASKARRRRAQQRPRVEFVKTEQRLEHKAHARLAG